MITVSEIQTTPPKEFKTALQKKVYDTLQFLQIPFERVDTDEVITMEDCAAINERLHMKMVKTLFLCNRQQTEFYVFVTCGEKPFRSKEFSSALGVARVSFAPKERMEEMLGTKIGAMTVFSALLESAKEVRFVFDWDVLKEPYYGCSDGTTTGYMKLKTEDVKNRLMKAAGHTAEIIEVE